MEEKLQVNKQEREKEEEGRLVYFTSVREFSVWFAVNMMGLCETKVYGKENRATKLL